MVIDRPFRQPAQMVDDILDRGGLIAFFQKQGQRDGTIASADPQGLAEVMMLLTNVWLNPMILISTPEKMAQRCRLYNELLRPQLGFELLDEEMLQKYIDYCGWYLRTAEEKGDAAAGGL